MSAASMSGDSQVSGGRGRVDAALRAPGRGPQPGLQVCQVEEEFNIGISVYISGRSWSTLCRSQPQPPQSAACQLQVNRADIHHGAIVENIQHHVTFPK